MSERDLQLRETAGWHAAWPPTGGLRLSLGAAYPVGVVYPVVPPRNDAAQGASRRTTYLPVLWLRARFCTTAA